jgi:outer membrane lipoprotein-sorting protein
MRFCAITLLLFSLIAACPRAESQPDKFDQIKTRLSSSRLVNFKIASAVDSKVFGQTDSVNGEVVIADDGRYLARMNDDLYLFDGKCIWEVSFENRQATKQCLKEGESFENRLFFIKDLDKYYTAKSVKKEKEYCLKRIEKENNSLPDSIEVFLDASRGRLNRLEYLDLNGDVNRVHIIDEMTSDSIDPRRFEMALPDSIEIINIP